MSTPLQNACTEIARIDDLIRDFVRSRRVVTIADIREFKYLKQCRRDQVSIINNAADRWRNWS